jgi:hypothetical protein
MYILIDREIVRMNTNSDSDICMLIGIPVCARGSVCVHAWRIFRGFGPFDPTSSHGCAGGAAARVAVGGRWISSSKVKALPDWLGQCKLLENLCVHSRRHAAVRVCGGAGAALRCWAWGCRGGRWAACAHVRRPRPTGAFRGGPEPPGAAARVARRDASNIELAELPAAADWPNLKTL